MSSAIRHGTVPGVVQKPPAARLERRTFTVDEVAQLLGVASATIYRNIARGRILAVRVGRRIVIPRWVVHDILGEPDAATISAKE